MVVFLSACGFSTSVFWEDLFTQKKLVSYPAPNIRVRDVRVTVPETLRVSEANTFYPNADIVWHGDPAGDRYQQVAAIFDESMTGALKQLHGQRAVYVDITVKQFHSLTPRTRYTFGGVHSIKFDLVVRDARSGKVLVEQQDVHGDLAGYGGNRAFQAERRGETQKVRIKAHLANLILKLLVQPETKLLLEK